jgi:mono/diheme cytochrome c family protein
MKKQSHPASLAGWTLIVTIAVAFVIAALAAPSARAADAAQATDAAADKAARGKYIVSTAGCHDCHTPFKPTANGAEPDMSRMLSGHPQDLKMPPAPTLPEGPWLIVSAGTNTAFSGPWGVSFTANLTPDPDTGLGQWTVQDFKNTIRTGRHMGRGRAILPPMPIPVYNNLTDADLEAVFAYLRTIPPIKNKVPEPWAPTAAVAK